MSDTEYSPEVLASSKEEKLSWADLQYRMIDTIFQARSNSDLKRFQASVNAFEMTMAGHRDDEYTKEINLAQNKKDIIAQEQGTETANIYYFDAKYTALIELSYRVNKGIERIRNRWKNSQLSKEISHQLINGIGQNIFITGKPGSGKSLTACAIAEEVTRQTGAPFDIEKNVVFTPQQFLKAYNNEKIAPPGGCIIYDEAGVTYSSKDTYDEANKLFSKLLQTIRHRSVLVIFTAPDLGFIAKDGRKLLHWWFETVKIDKKQKICTIKPFTVQISQRDGKILYPYPLFNGKQLVKIDVEKVSDNLEQDYERMAKLYKDDLAIETQMAYGLLGDERVARLKQFTRLRESGKTIKETCQVMRVHLNTGTKLEKQRKTILSA